jgi:hypothetical protein
MPVNDATKAQERNTEACDIRIRNVRRLIRECNVEVCVSTVKREGLWR